MSKDIDPVCRQCQSKCCQYFCFEIDEPDDFEEFDDIRWYLQHEGVSVHVDEDGDWFIQIDNPCNALQEDHRCGIYEDRPMICRNYGDSCEATGDDYGYQAEFKTPDQIREFAIKALGAESYHKELVKHRAKAEGIPRKEMKVRLLSLGLIPAGLGMKKKPKRKTK